MKISYGKMRTSDFYFASSEHPRLNEPRACWFVKRLKTKYRDDGMLIRIDPPIIGQQFGLDEDIDIVMILPRHKGVTLFPKFPFFRLTQVFQWPIYVYVLRLLVDPQQISDMLHEGEYTLEFWGELYRTRVGAKWSMRMWDKQHE